MDLSQLKPAKGATKKAKRIGRGEGSKRGGTSTKGHKGAQSRTGYSRKRGFEGGQMPLVRRVPKFGFTNPTRVEYKGINLDALQLLAENQGLKAVDPAVLYANGLIAKHDKLKVLGRGTLKGALDVTAHAFSATAKAAIEAIGGKATIIERKEKQA
ncbi:MAG: 50S ribosomal protein L15 [Flavobacteriales bacterium]|nr:50S ribosomal protein L15 [Flavobacteriales bacterium]MCC6577418.1 50S ribosomal protein L15 [Flavobacteriales bacterium]NUQ14708.1 50S ribosomal protein L15 [Flavobacteriales bacterium]